MRHQELASLHTVVHAACPRPQELGLREGGEGTEQSGLEAGRAERRGGYLRLLTGQSLASKGGWEAGWVLGLGLQGGSGLGRAASTGGGREGDGGEEQLFISALLALLA